MNLSMLKLTASEFAVMFGETRVGTVARDFNAWIGYFDKNKPYRASHENEAFLEMLREFNSYKLVGSNDRNTAKKKLNKLNEQVSLMAEKLGDHSVMLEKVLL